MKNIPLRSYISIGFVTITLFSWLYWYQWGAMPLTETEINLYISKIESQQQIPGGRHDIAALRSFLEQDDGKPIYTVNMYKFHAIADYPESSELTGTGAQAYDRFAKIMIPLMLRRASHPVFGSTYADEANSNWDRVIIVRYRSRRDLVDLFATDDFANASLHKWASIKEHDRMLVTALHLPDGKFAIISILLALAGLIFAVAALVKNCRKKVVSA